jgi:hypothetical protein
MGFKVALVAAIAAGILSLGGCGGGRSDSGGSAGASGDTGGASGDSGAADSAGGTTTDASVPPGAPDADTLASSVCPANFTVLGGNLFVAEQGPIGVTLLDDGGVGRLPGIVLLDGTIRKYEFRVMYDTVFGMPPGSVSNQQDIWSVAEPLPTGTSVGTSAQVDLGAPRPDLAQINPGFASTYPKGVPVQLWLTYTTGNPSRNDFQYHYSSTASIRKDVPVGTDWYWANVTYGSNHTATVTFFPGTALAHFTVGLTNVIGTGCPGNE